MTVALFSAVFLFVNRFPAPTPQGTSQFQATLLRTANQSYIRGISILHEAGSNVVPDGQIYLSSSRATSDWQFGRANGVPVGWGIGNSTAGWEAGQTWTTTLGTLIKVPENVTITIVANSVLLYEIVLPGSITSVPPVVVSTSVVPSTPAVGSAFVINATLSGNLTGATATIALGGVPGLTATPQAFSLNTKAGTGGYAVSAGQTTTSGTFFAFIQGSNSAGQTFSGTVTVTLVAKAVVTGVSTSVNVYPLPASIRTNETLTATVNNPGPGSVSLTNVTFYVNVTTNVTNAITKLKTFSASAALTLAAGQNVIVSPSTPWMPRPAAIQGQNEVVTVTAVTLYNTTKTSVGSLSFVIQPAPFSASVTSYVAGVATTSSTWNLNVTLQNLGSLGGSFVNVSVCVNKTATTTALGSVYAPPAYTVAGNGCNALLLTNGWATPRNSTTPTHLGAQTNILAVAHYNPGGGATAFSLTVTVVVQIWNPLWTGPAYTPVVILRTATTVFTD